MKAMTAMDGRTYGSGRSQSPRCDRRGRARPAARRSGVAATFIAELIPSRLSPILEGHQLAGVGAAPLVEDLGLQSDHAAGRIAGKELLATGEVATAVELDRDEVLQVRAALMHHPAPQLFLLRQGDHALREAIVGRDRAGLL